MYIIIETTSDSMSTCKNISQNLLELKLSPCINISNKSNTQYIWKEKILSDKEHTIRIKCLKHNKTEIINFIKNRGCFPVREAFKSIFWKNLGFCPNQVDPPPPRKLGHRKLRKK